MKTPWKVGRDSKGDIYICYWDFIDDEKFIREECWWGPVNTEMTSMEKVSTNWAKQNLVNIQFLRH